LKQLRAGTTAPTPASAAATGAAWATGTARTWTSGLRRAIAIGFVAIRLVVVVSASAAERTVTAALVAAVPESTAAAESTTVAIVALVHRELGNGTRRRWIAVSLWQARPDQRPVRQPGIVRCGFA
jgi:hypothetical protein